MKITLLALLCLSASAAPQAIADGLDRTHLPEGGFALARAQPLAAPCDAVEGRGLTSAIGPGQFQGTVDDLTIDGELRPAFVTVSVLEMRMTADGTIQATTAHVYELGADEDGLCEDGEDCFETLDHTVLAPSDTVPGLFRMNEVNRIAGGHGDFEDASGRLVTHGWLDFITGSAEWRARGRVCR